MNDDYVHGINKMKKPATKVMAPPGGQTSINLFGGPEPSQKHTVNKCQASRNQSSVFGGPTEEAPSKPTAAAASVNVVAGSSESEIVTNPLPKVAPVTADGTKAASRPSTKVMAPPGGKTSINLFG